MGHILLLGCCPPQTPSPSPALAKFKGCRAAPATLKITLPKYPPLGGVTPSWGAGCGGGDPCGCLRGGAEWVCAGGLRTPYLRRGPQVCVGVVVMWGGPPVPGGGGWFGAGTVPGAENRGGLVARGHAGRAAPPAWGSHPRPGVGGAGGDRVCVGGPTLHPPIHSAMGQGDLGTPCWGGTPISPPPRC